MKVAAAGRRTSRTESMDQGTIPGLSMMKIARTMSTLCSLERDSKPLRSDTRSGAVAVLSRNRLRAEELAARSRLDSPEPEAGSTGG